MENIEQHNYKVSRQLFEKAGELGLLGIEVPEDYGGFELGKAVSGLVAEKMGYAGAFSVSFNIRWCRYIALHILRNERTERKIFTKNRIGRMDWGLCFN